LSKIASASPVSFYGLGTLRKASGFYLQKNLRGITFHRTLKELCMKENETKPSSEVSKPKPKEELDAEPDIGTNPNWFRKVESDRLPHLDHAKDQVFFE
jgi:hypothetical protein